MMGLAQIAADRWALDVRGGVLGLIDTVQWLRESRYKRTDDVEKRLQQHEDEISVLQEDFPRIGPRHIYFSFCNALNELKTYLGKIRARKYKEVLPLLTNMNTELREIIDERFAEAY